MQNFDVSEVIFTTLSMLKYDVSAVIFTTLSVLNCDVSEVDIVFNKKCPLEYIQKRSKQKHNKSYNIVKSISFNDMP